MAVAVSHTASRRFSLFTTLASLLLILLLEAGPVLSDDSKLVDYIIVTKEANSSDFQAASEILGVEDFLDAFYENKTHMFSLFGASDLADEDKPKVGGYKTLGLGFVAGLNNNAVKMIKKLHDVDFVEKDKKVEAAETLEWHLDRIDQANLPLDNEYRPKYTGKDVDIYILDTGIRYTHEVFGGRASFGGYDHFGGNGEDCQSHGTHVAGLAGGNTTGAAVGTNLYSIKVLGCGQGGSFSGVIAGIEQVVANTLNSEGESRVIISMSLVGSKSQAIEIVLKQAYDAGIVTVVAAGNFRKDACLYSPASSPWVITVGGTKEQGDGLYWFPGGSGTNTGKCVDIFAPGQWIRSASHLSDTGIVSKSGTSMATPLVSGVVAMLLEEDPSLTPEQVKEEVIKRSTKDVLDFSLLPDGVRQATPNRMIIAPSHDVATDPPTPPPVDIPIPSGEPQTLPEKPNQVTVHLRRRALKKDGDKKAARGFVPTSVNTYMKGRRQYFVVVYTYVGTENVHLYRSSYMLRLGSVQAKLQSAIPIAFALHDVEGDTRVFLVTKAATNNDEDHILSLGQTLEEFRVENETLRATGYQPIVLRYTQQPDGTTLVHAIYQKWAYVRVHSDLTVQALRTLAYASWSQKWYLVDVTYKTKQDGTVVYTAIFSGVPRAIRNFFLDVRGDHKVFRSTYESVRKALYHAATVCPMPDSQGGVGFIGVYWRA